MPPPHPERAGSSEPGSERANLPGTAGAEEAPAFEVGELEDLVVEAERAAEVEAPNAVAVEFLESGRPPEEPPRHLPTIGRFGTYDIVGRLALGGMAEILLAREEAPGAGSRYLVVKRILPEYEKEEAFVEMFLDEARVMMRLRHPNVCHVYKFGQQDGTHFIAMEWIDGASLGKLIRRARTAGGLPIAVACKVIACIAEALDHAHVARDESDRPLGIVHRDVTPDNVMVSYDGSIKLLDFGIAKADARAHKTQAGVVKGKFAYMAPEQCRGKELDHRVDVFALGICLYESLTGRPLYRRETEFETMEAIVRGPVPTLADRMSDAHPELERIIASCLAKRPDDRFASAGELQEALDRFVASRGEVVTARHIKTLMGKLFREEMKRGPTVDTAPFGSSYHVQTSDVQLPVFAATNALESLPLPELDIDPAALRGGVEPTAPLPYWGPPAAPDDPRPGVTPGAALKTDPRPAPTAPPRVRVPPPAEERGGVALKWVGIGGGALVLVAGLAYVGMNHLGPRDEAPAEPEPALAPMGTLVIDTEPSGATLFVDGEEVGPTPATVPRLATGTHAVRLMLEGYQEYAGQVEVRAGPVRRIVERLAPLEQPEAAPPGRLSLTTQPVTEVHLRGQHLGRTPLSGVEVPSGVLPLELVMPNGYRYRRAVLVRPGELTPVHVDLTGPE